AVAQLIAETLHTSSELIAPLAELIWRKTNGNPYFTNEFLKTLYIEGLIVFNINQQHWEWDVAQIKAKNITDNVVELMIGKLKQLPEETQRVLRLAACVGAEFDLATLSAICERPAVEIFAELITVIQLELILATSELDENLLIQHYKFSHDRVQQAAYTLIDEEQLQTVHLQIGYCLLKINEPETRSANLFEVIDHLNLGRDLVTDQQERDKIARLNLIAGQKAKKALAHSAALQYLTTGIELLAADSWQFQYALTLALHEEATEAAYLCGDFQQMEQWAIVALENASTVLDKIKVYETKIQASVAQGRQKEAIKIGLEVLELLGIALPETPAEADVQRQLKEMANYFNAIDIEDLLELPLMKEPDKLAAMQILSSLVGAAYHTTPSLLPLIVLEQINLSAQYGNTSFASFAYATYGGVILNGIMRNFEGAYQFAELALSLTERLDSKKFKPRVTAVVATYLMHCKAHLRQTLPLFQEAHEAGLETGDLEFIMYAAALNCMYAYFAGLELTKITSAIRVYSNALAQFKQENILIYFCRLQQVIFNLLEQVENPGRLLGNQYNEEQFLPIHFETNDRTHLCNLYLDELILSYLFEDFPQAVEYASQAELYLDGNTGTFLVPVFYFYDSLAQIQIYQSVSDSEQEHLLPKINNNQEKMQKWAHSAPVNFQHKYELVEAEKARILGQFFEAEELYEQAMQGARDNEYLQEEALAYELAAKHYLARGRAKIAQTYMKEAHYCYERWGARAKVKDLKTRYPQLFPQSSAVAPTSIRTPSETTSNSSPIAFDLAAVMRSSQAISSEIELEHLLRSLIQMLIENAGAQTGFLLLETSGEWLIEASCELSAGENACSTQVLKSNPITNRLPESIIQYVIRTHETVILDDATREGNFIHESYIQRHQTQSILCLPLLNQSQLVGVLYLENQLAAGAFTPDRSQVLNLLSTQAAIAIENARLYSKLRTSKNQMSQFLEAVPVGIGIVDTVGRIYYVNQRAIQLLGKGIDPTVTPEQFAEVYQLYVRGTDQIYPIEKLPILRVLCGESSRISDLEIHQNDVVIPVEAWGTPVFDEQGNITYAIAAFQDISQRKQAESMAKGQQMALQRTLAYLATEPELDKFLGQVLATVVEQLDAPVACLWLNDDEQEVSAMHLIRWNTQLVPNPPATPSLIVVPFSVFRQLDAWEPLHHHYQPFAYSDLSNHPDMEIYRAWSVLPEGVQSLLLIPLVFGDDLLGVFSISHLESHAYSPEAVDLVTALAQQVVLALQLTRLAEDAKQVAVVEEHNRLAREIHDTLAQTFTGISLQLNNAQYYATQDVEIAWDLIEQVKILAKTGLAEARRSVWSLHPDADEYRDLAGSLQRSLRQLTLHTNLKADLTIVGTPQPVPPDIGMNLLRIGQEAITNTLRHAQAQTLHLELTFKLDAIMLHIQDDGRGFNSQFANDHGGFGLLGIQQRCDRLGGEFSLHSQPGQGTCILIQIPFTFSLP
ncbi:MAG: GAF domain-containing protein, partial [Rhizonema sp. PD38]|nr:GAF domain-containing protein [Rhizonema sp. PD38]